MNRHKLNRFVEYICNHVEFPFDVIDVVEDIEAVVSYFRQHPELDDEERSALLHDFYPIASEAELREIAQLAV